MGLAMGYFPYLTVDMAYLVQVRLAFESTFLTLLSASKYGGRANEVLICSEPQIPTVVVLSSRATKGWAPVLRVGSG